MTCPFFFFYALPDYPEFLVTPQMERLPVILFTTSRCYRELASPSSQDCRYKPWGGSLSSGGLAVASMSSPCKPRQLDPGSSSSSSSSSSGSSGGGVGCKGEFDPLIEAVKAVRSCSTIMITLLTFPRALPSRCLTLSARASMAVEMVSSTAFGEAVKEAMVRSPSRDLRANAMSVLASLARIDRQIAGEEGPEGEGGSGGGGSTGCADGDGSGFISLTTVMVSVRVRFGFAVVLVLFWRYFLA